MAAIRTRLLDAAATGAGWCYDTAVLIQERLQIFQPLVHYAARAFHIGFIPFVIMLGMRTTDQAGQRPKLTDLLTPM